MCVVRLTIIWNSPVILKHSRKKLQTLQQTRCLNPHSERVKDSLFQQHPFFDARDLVQVKYEMLRKVQVKGHSVTRSSQCFGLSRPTFYKARRAFEQNGLPGLLPAKTGSNKARKLKPPMMDALLEAQQKIPAPTIRQLQQLLLERFELSVHRTTIERALARAKKNSA